MTSNEDGAMATPTPRKRESAATIYDIARVAGVSPSTVSRALNKPGRLSAATEKRILEAAAELNYQANPMARALPTGRTLTIGLVVADITTPRIFDVVRGAGHAATLNDYTLVLVESEESPGRELRAVERLLHTVDGIILATSRLTDEEITGIALRKPVSVINREVADVPSIVADVDRGVAEAVRHLVHLGHQSVLYVPGPETSWMSRHRWRSIRSRCEWSQIAVDTLSASPPTIDGGRSAAAAVRAHGATAIITYNDLMAIGLSQELVEGGVAVPGQLSVVGFDDIFGSDFAAPPLTTIKSPLREEGALAVRQIIGELNETAMAPDLGGLATTLVVRGSTGRAPVDYQ
jgi:DNA-binding LacI/PurR family transcriptional regulator